jgi:putative heme-binding domain-containing protein
VDTHSAVRRETILLAEPQFERSEELSSKLAELAGDRDASVRFQVALSIGTASRNSKSPTLLAVARTDADDPWIRAAVLSSAADVRQSETRIAAKLCGSLMLDALAGDQQHGRTVLLRELATMVGAAGDRTAIQSVLASVSGKAPMRETCYAVLSGLGQGLARRRQRLGDLIATMPNGPKQQLEEQISETSRLAIEAKMPTRDRIEAIRLLQFLTWDSVRDALIGCLKPAESAVLQQTAIRVVGSFNEQPIAGELVSRWKQLTPPLRDEAVTILLSRPIWHEPLIAALEKGDIPISQVSIPQRTRLAAIKDEKLAERAKKILASFALGPRKEVIDRYQESLSLKGDVSRGQIVYRRECLNCHKLRGEGHDVGPSLETVQHRSPQEILIHVLDPNREVSPNFLEYVVRLADGRVLTGLISTETDSGLTLRRAQNQEDNILRSEIEDIAASGKSLMPEGLEQKINPQEMADLIVYLKQN